MNWVILWAFSGTPFMGATIPPTFIPGSVGGTNTPTIKAA